VTSDLVRGDARRGLQIETSVALALSTRVTTDKVIAQLRKAERALCEATTIHETKVVADVAAAQEVFASRQQLGETVIGYAHSIKTHALAKLGELLRQMPKAGGPGVAGPGRGKTDHRSALVPDRSTYAELGIDKKTAAVAQALAELPEPVRQAIATREMTVTKACRARASQARRTASSATCMAQSNRAEQSGRATWASTALSSDAAGEHERQA